MTGEIGIAHGGTRLCGLDVNALLQLNAGRALVRWVEHERMDTNIAVYINNEISSVATQQGFKDTRLSVVLLKVQPVSVFSIAVGI